MTDDEAIHWVRGTIRSEMAKRRLTYADLALGLRDTGVDENERNLRNKVARGTFSAAFFFQCMQAMGVTNLNLDALDMVRQLMPGRMTNEQVLAGIETDPEDHELLDEIRNILAPDEDE